MFLVCTGSPESGFPSDGGFRRSSEQRTVSEVIGGSDENLSDNLDDPDDLRRCRRRCVPGG